MTESFFPDNLEDMRRLAQAEGVNLSTKTSQQKIADVKRAARDIALADRATETGAGNDKWAKQLESVIVQTGNVLRLSLILVISAVLSPIAVIFLAWVEIERVSSGVALFDARHAPLMAVTAIFAYLILLVVKADLAYKEYGTLEKPIGSLRSWLDKLAYRVGIGNNWQPRHTTPLQRLEGVLFVVASIIVLLGTVGSMKSLLVGSGAWYQSLAGLFTGSNLIDFLTIIGGLTYTWGLLVATDWVVSYNYRQFRRLLPDSDDIDTGAVETQAEYDFLANELRKVYEKRGMTFVPVQEAETDYPKGDPIPTSVAGNGYH